MSMLQTWFNTTSSGSSYWKPLNLKASGRSDLIIPDIYGNDISILPSCGLCDANNYCGRDEPLFGASASGYVEIRFYYTGTAGSKYLFSISDVLTDTKMFVLSIEAGKPRIFVSNASPVVYNQYLATNAISVGWHTVKFISSGTAYSINVDGSAVSGAMGAGTNNGKWTNQVLATDNCTVGYIKSLSKYYGTDFYIEYIDLNNTNYWVFSGQGIYTYDLKGGKGFTWTGTNHIYSGSTVSTRFLDIGFSLYAPNTILSEKGSDSLEYVPFLSTDTPYEYKTQMASVGYHFIKDIYGDIANYNLAPALLEFSSLSVNYDRSNIDIHNSLARVGSDYDVLHPFRWRGIDLCNPEIYYSWKNDGYESKQFVKIDHQMFVPTKMHELISFSSNKSANGKLYIEKYCNIDKFLKREDYLNKGFGLMVSFGPSTFTNTNSSAANANINIFNPTDFNLNEILDTAKTAGMKLVTWCIKTDEGFCQWPTLFHDPGYVPYSIAETTWYANNGQIDIAKALTDGCRIRGLKPCFYFSIWDRTHEARTGTTSITDPTSYIAMIKSQLSELLTNYGDIYAIWIDTWQWAISYAYIPFYDNIYNYIKSIQPDCIVLNNEHLHPALHSEIEIYETATTDGNVPEGNVRLCEEVQSIHLGGYWQWYINAPQGNGADAVMNKAQILAAILQANSRNSVFQLSIGPDRTGRITTVQKNVLESLTT